MPEETPGRLVSSAQFQGFRLSIQVDRNEVVRRNAVYQHILLGIVILYLLLIPVLYLEVRRIFIRPLQQVNEAHRRIERGEQDYRLPDSAKTREFEEANRSFNRMADNIRQLKIDVYEIELEKQHAEMEKQQAVVERQRAEMDKQQAVVDRQRAEMDKQQAVVERQRAEMDKQQAVMDRQRAEMEKQQMELQNLQLQIRPHFLQNTFNLVYNLARKGDNGSVQTITLYLSDYFRYIFRNGKELELFAKERQLIEAYVEVAAMRYDGEIELHTDLDPETDFVRVPPLLIHNFIENSVKYGYRTGQTLHIDLQGRVEDGTVSFTVLDDGNGMAPDVLERNRRIFAGELVPENTGLHVGLYNSLRRLKNYYGEEASIEVMSDPGEITCFTISFPYDFEGVR